MTACAPNWKAVALGVGGLALTFGAPQHRLDLLLIGLAATLAAVVWSPLSGPVLVGAGLPFFFFSRTIVGPLSFTPPGLALTLAWVAIAVRHRTLRLRWPSTGYDAPLALFLLAALLSLFVTQYPLLSVRELRAVIFEPILWFWMLYVLPGSAIWGLGGFVGAATLTAVAAVLQGPLGVGGTQTEGVLRVQAWYPSANHLALTLGRAWAFLLAGALLWRRWLWIPTVATGLALVLTFSTGGWVGAAVAALAVLARAGKRKTALGIGALALTALVLVSGLAVAGVLPERLNPLRQTGGFRLDLWLSSLEMIRDHPVFGVGLDNFAYVYQQLYLREGAAAEPSLSHPHNWILNFWLSLGILGLAAFVLLVTRFWKLGRGHLSWYVIGATGAIADLLVHGFIDNSYFLVDLAFVFWLSLALVEARIGST